MPNKRDPNKQGVSLFIPKELRREWKAESEKRGMNLKEYCVFLIETARKKDMPNKRNPDRIAFGIALNIKTLKLLKTQATKQCTNISNLLEELIIEKYMPNKRDPEKKNMSFWLKKAKFDKIESLAQQKGMTKTEFAEYAIELALNLEAEKEQQSAKKKI